MRRVFVRAALVAGLLLIAGTGLPAAEDDPPWLANLKRWSRAVASHVPGQADEAVQELASWSAADVSEVVRSFLATRTAVDKALQQARARRPRPWIEYRERRLWVDDLQELAVFGDSADGGPNRILRRAALLHADVALLAALDVSTKTGEPDTVKVIDGVIVGYESQSSHWVVGRQLLDAITPAPDADPFVHLWYYAIAARFLEMSNLSAAHLHLRHALDVLPSDANIRYESGYWHQSNAAPSIDAIRRLQGRAKTRLRASGSLLDQSTDDHLKAAERRFREAVTLNPAHLEAQVRLGAVLLALDRPGDATAQLRPAAAAAEHPLLTYYAHLLLGQAEERAGRIDAAETAYERARALFPDARSPAFGLAELARRRGERERAWDLVAPLVLPEEPGQDMVDPWGAFLRWQLKSSAVLLDELRAAAAAEVRR
jgi:tetratricopeptide (TPR) repeat protein